MGREVLRGMDYWSWGREKKSDIENNRPVKEVRQSGRERVEAKKNSEVVRGLVNDLTHSDIMVTYFLSAINFFACFTWTIEMLYVKLAAKNPKEQ
ncbi:hypothetical protein JTB14_019686 [Gonioctena quinquepunctata]|nr:hypothetical protein JTB14_019686 [Gonioctena quinquepunctata]